MDKEQAKRIASEYVNGINKANHLNIIKAYLFGSFAKNTNREDSDIDIAIIFKDLESRLDMRLKLMKLRRDFDLSLEPHPFEQKDFNLSNPFATEILETGEEITIN